jgi:flagellar FliJ protein
MKRFEFKLQAVLTLRQRAEQAALEKYGRAIQSRQAAAERLAAADMELSESRRLWLNALADGCPAAQAAQTQAFCRGLEESRRQLDEALHVADVELQRSSQHMLLARQHREAVEKYLERQRDEYDRLLRIEERKMLDDILSRRPPASPPDRSPAENAWN